MRLKSQSDSAVFIGKIVPKHCTTILKATLQEVCDWLWKCWISLKIPKTVFKSIAPLYLKLRFRKFVIGLEVLDQPEDS